ncbi:hypothetical protein KIPB_001542 [Kipferlia bialata]|uniref:Cilia- and flagella-associated protein 58 central coiled coil domain-containing protein n=1 Tax=Kipferlia bialata TaxID=797122 RepID=A0A9K3CS50_9EUKA|nr:hypothetical protein KIPB_001542 [Kipferlia bialata]|eukprot:g1542.t1
MHRLRQNREELRLTVAALKLRDNHVKDLGHHLGDIERQLRQFTVLYDKVKSQRNKFNSLTQQAKQAILETAEKLGILENEVALLSDEALKKGHTLSSLTQEREGIVTECDALRQDVGKNTRVLGESHEQLRACISELDRLTGVISSLEEEISSLRSQYTGSIEERNFTGVQLIDRNDELAVLYERFNVREKVLRESDRLLADRDQDLRVLSIQTKDLERAIDVTRRQAAEASTLKAEHQGLLDELVQAKEETERLAHRARDTGTENRMLQLPGEQPDLTKLVEKAQDLEQRITDKKEAFLERQVVLDELGKLEAEIRSTIKERRQDMEPVRMAVSRLQAALHKKTKQLQALVSETSMFQMMTLALHREGDTLRAEVTEQRERFEDGLPPTDEAEQEWLRMEQTRLDAIRQQASIREN